MIHEPLSSARLTELLRIALPFSASVTKHALRAQVSDVIRSKQRLRIDGGPEGGIFCSASLGGEKGVLAISITHLQFDLSHPLYKQIRAYQIHRIKELAAAEIAQDSRP